MWITNFLGIWGEIFNKQIFACHFKPVFNKQLVLTGVVTFQHLTAFSKIGKLRTDNKTGVPENKENTLLS
jgi:hypothetical protein